MFSMVLFSARLSATRPQAIPPGLRKSFCRSVITSAVRRGSMIIPGLGRSMVSLLSRRRGKSVSTGFRQKERDYSSAEALLPGETPQRLHPGVTEQAPRLLLGTSPGRDGLLEQGPPCLGEAKGMDARVVPRHLLQPAVRPHQLEVPA